METGDIVYRVYWYKGEVVVRKGKIGAGRNFVPDDNPKTYLTQNPTVPMKIEHGKVYCCDVEDIPKAIEMVKRHHDFYLEEAQDRLNRSKNGGPLYKRTKSDSPLICPKCQRQFNMGGSRRKLNWTDGIMMDGHKFRKSECFHCGCEFYFCNASADYARECGLKCVYEKDEFERMVREMDERKAIDILKKEEAERRDASYIAYSMAIKALEEKAKKKEEEDRNSCKAYKPMIYEYTFTCTEAEFVVMKHALHRLYMTSKYKLDPKWRPNYSSISLHEKESIETEMTVIGDLLNKMYMAEDK